MIFWPLDDYVTRNLTLLSLSLIKIKSGFSLHFSHTARQSFTRLGHKGSPATKLGTAPNNWSYQVEWVGTYPVFSKGPKVVELPV